MLPRFDVARRIRPVDLLAPGAVRVDTSSAGTVALPAVAPYVAATAAATDACAVALLLPGVRLRASLAGGSVSLVVTVGDDTSEPRSRRFHRAEDPRASA